MNNSSHEKIIQSINAKTDAEKAKSMYLRRRVVAGLLGAITVVAASPVIEYGAHKVEQAAHQGTKVMDYATQRLDGLFQDKHNIENDIAKFNIANNPTELDQVLKLDGKTEKDVKLVTISGNALTEHDAVLEINSVNPNKVLDIIDAQLRDPATKVLGEVHDREVILPVELLQHPAK